MSEQREGFIFNQLTDNQVTESFLGMDGATVVWSRNDGNDDELYAYNGSQVVQLTDNSTSYDDNYYSYPKIDGSNIFYRSISNDGDDYELYFFDGTNNIRLTNNDGSDELDVTLKNRAVWQDGENNDLYYYNGSDTARLTEDGSSYNQGLGILEDGRVIYEGYDGNSTELYLYNGVSSIPLSDDSTSSDALNWYTDSGNIFYQGFNESSSQYELFLYNGSKTKIGESENKYEFAAGSDSNVVWTHVANDETDTEIYLYNDSSDSLERITNNSNDDTYLGVSGDNVVWTVSDGNDAELYLYNGNKTIQLTDNDSNDDTYQGILLNKQVIYSAYNGQDDTELFLFNGSGTIQLTDDGENNELDGVSGNSAVWTNNDGVYLYNGSTDIKIADSNYEYQGMSGNYVVLERNVDYHSDLYVYNGSRLIQLTDNDNYDVDKFNQISNGNISWQTKNASNNDSELNIAQVDTNPSPVYRFLRKDNGSHFYTASPKEKDAIIADPDLNQNYVYEGSPFAGAPNYLAASEEPDPLTGFKPVYRFLNNSTGAPLYTISEEERDNIKNNAPDYSFEGISYYAYETQKEGTIPMYRLEQTQLGIQLFTSSAEERDAVLNNPIDGDKYQLASNNGIAFYVEPLEI